METVVDIKERAVLDMRQRLFKRGLFRRSKMKKVAKVIARNYSSGLCAENLLALARHDTWLKDRRMHGADKRKDKVTLIRDKLESFLRRELRELVNHFWRSRTSMELVVGSSSVELVGFFNKERPPVHYEANDPFEEMLHKQQQAPYA